MSDNIFDRRLLASYAVASWATTLDHLEFLEGSGLTVPPVVLSRIRREHFMAALVFKGWPVTTTEYDRKTVTKEARTHVTNHQGRLNALLRERE